MFGQLAAERTLALLQFGRQQGTLAGSEGVAHGSLLGPENILRRRLAALLDCDQGQGTRF
jgi:hypothetical protein